MPGETKHGIECAEFEALLSEVLDFDGDDDQQLSPARKESFDAHRRVCKVCGPMFVEAKAGQQWLRALKLEAFVPPPHLVHNILAATSGVASRRPVTATATAGGGTIPFGQRLREWWDSFFGPATALVRQPRFVMSFGMIFFTFSLALNVAGVKASDVAKVDLRPTALRHAYYDAQNKVVKYYDNIRFVYEIESKVRELKRANTPAEPGPQQQEQKNNRKNDTSGQPEQKQDRNYSREEGQTVLAASEEVSIPRASSYELRATSNHSFARSTWPLAHSLEVEKIMPAVTETTNRRFV